jgi:nucleotide-binding universal stress UspA family protein
MKNILVLVHDDAGQEARVQAALDVVRAVDGHLTCLDVAAIMPFVGEDVGVSGGAMLISLEQEREAANRSKLEPRIAAEGVPFSWVDTTDYFEAALERAAALADFVVVNLADPELADADERALAGRLALEAGKPILAVPEKARGFDAAGSALVAWDGSREASHALCAAVPLLRLAEGVTLLEIDDGSVRVPAEEAAAYLSRHGVHAAIVREPGGPVADAILGRCGVGTAYLVMGAFGHSRMTEALFGGVTRRLLRESPVPLLIAH